MESEINRFETQSEMMSTSTVSKAEEIHRMKDVEDSLEERYNKLKTLAIRMKKKIAEQQSQLATLDSSNIRSIPINLQVYKGLISLITVRLLLFCSNFIYIF